MESQGAEELAVIAQARAAVADRLVTPWWYHPVLGLLLAGYVVALSLGNVVVTLLAVVVFGAGCGALVSAYRRITGVWVSGFSAGGANRWLRALALVGLVVMGASWGIAYWTEVIWPVFLFAAVLFVATVVAGRGYDAALRAHLRAGA